MKFEHENFTKQLSKTEQISFATYKSIFFRTLLSISSKNYDVYETRENRIRCEVYFSQLDIVNKTSFDIHYSA